MMDVPRRGERNRIFVVVQGARCPPPDADAHPPVPLR
jgi:hypothetical protein